MSLRELRLQLCGPLYTRYVTNAITSPLLPLYLTGTNHPLHAFAVGSWLRGRPAGLLFLYPRRASNHPSAGVLIQLFLMEMAPHGTEVAASKANEQRSCTT